MQRRWIKHQFIPLVERCCDWLQICTLAHWLFLLPLSVCRQTGRRPVLLPSLQTGWQRHEYMCWYNDCTETKYQILDCNLPCRLHRRGLTFFVHTASLYCWEKILLHENTVVKGAVEKFSIMQIYHTQPHAKRVGLNHKLLFLIHLLCCNIVCILFKTFGSQTHAVVDSDRPNPGRQM